MKQEKINGIIIFGWFLIAFSFLYTTIVVFNIISLHHKLVSLCTGLSDSINFPPKLTIYSVITISIGFLFLFVAGIGILKLKRWAYYTVLSIPFIYSIATIKDAWIFGLRSIIRPLALLLGIFVSIIILLFLMRKNIIEQFRADYITKRGKKINPKKVIFILLIIVVLVNVVSVTLWLLFINIKYKDQLPIINLRPQKIEYGIQDKNFILNNCEKIDVFDYSIYIPKDWKISMISREDSGCGLGWHLSFLNSEDSSSRAFIMLDSEGVGSKLLLFTSKILNFNSLYDFEKTINYPNLTPIYLTMKMINSRKNLRSIDEATASTWRGFVKIVKSKEKKFFYGFYGSLYSLKGDNRGVAVLFKDGVMTSEQAKSIIASLEFRDIDRKSEYLFEKGQADLSNADFTSATINFMNALYIDERNPEYAYYLARSLFEDNSVVGREDRLSSSKKFLKYALKLNPDYQKANELFASVDNEIKQRKQGQVNKNKTQ